MFVSSFSYSCRFFFLSISNWFVSNMMMVNFLLCPVRSIIIIINSSFIQRKRTVYKSTPSIISNNNNLDKMMEIANLQKKKFHHQFKFYQYVRVNACAYWNPTSLMLLLLLFSHFFFHSFAISNFHFRYGT